MKKNIAYLSLGSNIEPEENLRKAMDRLAAQVEVVRTSQIWETEAIGSSGPAFLNAAVEIYTNLEAHDLKEHILNGIETSLGRVRSSDKYAPRTIDLDIILFNGEIVDQNLWKYLFVALPMAEFLPDFRNPESGETISAAANRLLQTTHVKLHG